jgi:U3 small nucleolar RNA-associated protein 3
MQHHSLSKQNTTTTTTTSTKNITSRHPGTPIIMGRRSRHSAKTGGSQSNQKSRTEALESSRGNRDDSDDDDPMYNEVERYHNRMEEENYLKLDVDDDEGGDSSSEDDGITKHQEGVFDLGIGGSSDEEDGDDGDSDVEEEEEMAAPRAKKSHATSSSDSDGDFSESEDNGVYGAKSNKLLNWGDKKYSYYHGDTADLEIGQDVEDAYLEEEAAREVEKAQLDDMDDEDFFLGTNVKSSEDEEPKSNKKLSKNEGDMEIIKSSKSPKDVSKLSDKEKMKLLKTHHPELLPLVQHFSHSVSELSETTLVAAGAMLGNGVTKCSKEMEVNEFTSYFLCLGWAGLECVCMIALNMIGLNKTHIYMS